MRLFLTKAAHAFPSSAAKQEIRVRLGPTARHFPNPVPQGRLNFLNLAQDVSPTSVNLFGMFFFKPPTKSSAPTTQKAIVGIDNGSRRPI
jgi:hypothetical protein